jgi:hypothetical protein
MRSQQPPGPQGPYVQQPSDGSWQPPNGPIPPGEGWQSPPGGPYQQPRPRKRRRGLKITLGIIGGIVVLIIMGAALGGGKSGTTGANTSTGTGSSAAAPDARRSVPGVGDKVRDGKFEFVVTKIRHADSVGDTQDGLGETAQGRFLIVSLKVTNIGNQSQTLDDSSQYLYDTSGRKFSPNSAADLDLGGVSSQNSTWFQDINPGNTVHGRIAFDMPRGDKAANIELHDSMFSEGVTVKLH